MPFVVADAGPTVAASSVRVPILLRAAAAVYSRGGARTALRGGRGSRPVASRAATGHGQGQAAMSLFHNGESGGYPRGLCPVRSEHWTESASTAGHESDDEESRIRVRQASRGVPACVHVFYCIFHPAHPCVSAPLDRRCQLVLSVHISSSYP